MFLIVLSLPDIAGFAIDGPIPKHNEATENKESGHPADEDIEKVMQLLENKRNLSHEKRKTY